jgi:hypothetical protein
MDLRKGNEVTEPWLAKQVHPHGIRPRTIRIAGVVAKGYLETDFAEVFRRYVAKSEVEALVAEAPGPTSDASDPVSQARDQKPDAGAQPSESRDSNPGGADEEPSI